MSQKQELINKMLEMQKKFRAYEHENGVDPVDYYTPQPGHPLAGYIEEYNNIAREVNQLAHNAVGSKA